MSETETITDTLHRAAAVIRERAKACQESCKHFPENYKLTFGYGEVISGFWTHYFAVTPEVGLALADWLDAEAQRPETEHEGGAYSTGGPSLMALRVARAYLGESE